MYRVFDCLGGLCTDGVFEFNVPSSTSTGGLQHPPPEFQFPVDRSSNQGESGGVGDDWRYLGTYANSARFFFLPVFLFCVCEPAVGIHIYVNTVRSKVFRLFERCRSRLTQPWEKLRPQKVSHTRNNVLSTDDQKIPTRLEMPQMSGLLYACLIMYCHGSTPVDRAAVVAI